MSEEFKKEEINGEAAEETKAAEHTEEVKAETTAEQSAAETEKPQETAEAPKAEEKKTTTYSWVNPKISGKTGEENNSASYTGKPDPSEAKAEQTSSAKTEHYQYQSQTQSAPKQEKPQFSAVPQPQDHKKKAKKPMSAAKKWGMTLAMAACFGLVAGGVFIGTAAVGTKVIGTATEQKQEVTIPTTTTTTAADSSDTSDTVKATGEMSVKDVASSAMPSLVAISTTTVEEVETFFGTTSQEVPASGTGVIVGQNDDELLIATNNHVVSGATSLSVSFIDDETVEGQIKGTDADNDLAVVAVKLSDIKDETKSQIKIAVMGNSDDLEVGDQVVAIGNALGTGQSLTSGYISAKDRTISSQDESTGETITSEGLIQTDAAINPGNSGGALLNMNGEVIGINSAKLASTEVEGMGYAISMNDAYDTIEELMNETTRTKVSDDEKASLGISGTGVSDEAAEAYGIPSGVFVSQVTEGGAAEQAGITANSIITAFDGKSVSDISELKSRLEYYKAGEEVEVTLQVPDGNGYTEKNVTVILGKADSSTSGSSLQSGSDESQDQNQGQDPYNYGGSDDNSGNYFRFSNSQKSF